MQIQLGFESFEQLRTSSLFTAHPVPLEPGGKDAPGRQDPRHGQEGGPGALERVEGALQSARCRMPALSWWLPRMARHPEIPESETGETPMQKDATRQRERNPVDGLCRSSPWKGVAVAEQSMVERCPRQRRVGYTNVPEMQGTHLPFNVQLASVFRS